MRWSIFGCLGARTNMVGLERRRNLRLDAVFFCGPHRITSKKKAGTGRLFFRALAAQ
jgi:hypothetical protein